MNSLQALPLWHLHALLRCKVGFDEASQRTRIRTLTNSVVVSIGEESEDNVDGEVAADLDASLAPPLPELLGGDGDDAPPPLAAPREPPPPLGDPLLLPPPAGRNRPVPRTPRTPRTARPRV
jgi:hypothetical protein